MFIDYFKTRTFIAHITSIFEYRLSSYTRVHCTIKLLVAAYTFGVMCQSIVSVQNEEIFHFYTPHRALLLIDIVMLFDVEKVAQYSRNKAISREEWIIACTSLAALFGTLHQFIWFDVIFTLEGYVEKSESLTAYQNHDAIGSAQLQFPAGTRAKKTRTPKHRNVESRIFSIFFLFISCEIQSIAIESLENFYHSLAIQKYLSSEQKRGEKNGEIVESCCRSVESKTLGHCGNMLISKTVAHRISVRFHVKNVCSLISDLTQNSTHMQIEFFLFTFFSRNIFWGSIFLH